MKLSLKAIMTFTVTALLLVGLSSETFAQMYKAGPQDLTFFSSADETNQPYSIYIPKDYDENEDYPLVIFLHGAMSNNRLGLRRAFGLGNIQGTSFTSPGFVHKESDLEVSRSWPEMPDIDFIVAAPFARGTAGYRGIPEQDVYDMLADIKEKFNVDEDRIYLTGLSMGGGGTVWLGLTRPDIWAAIAPCCAAPPTGAMDLYRNASNLPVHIFCGDKDGLLPNSIALKEKFEEIGSPVVNYIEYPGIGHNSWEYAYDKGFIFEWFSQFERDLFPQRVQFSSKLFKYNKAYWVTFDNLTPGTLAIIDAKFTAPNAVEVSSTDLLAFTLKLKGHPMFSPGKSVTVKVDGKSFSVKSPDMISFTKENGEWKNRKYTPGLTAKQKGAEGPLVAAVNSNHIYVYGTADNPSSEELNARMAQALEAATWANTRGSYLNTAFVFPRVVSDQRLRQSDYDLCNLVLFGTKETNAIIAQYADKLPMHLDKNVEDHGLVYIFPMNGKYVLINSGLPWWTPYKGGGSPSSILDGAGKSGYLANSTSDFILFKEAADNIIVQGNFDSNWELTKASVNGLVSTSIVTVNE